MTHFVQSPSDMGYRLGRLDFAPDRDGRYRINDLFCSNDAWKPTFQQLIGTSSAILIDLRGYGLQHVGVTYEIQQLATLARLNRVVAITDETTSMDALHQAIAPVQGYARERIDLRELKLFHVRRRGLDAERLFKLLCRTATQC